MNKEYIAAIKAINNLENVAVYQFELVLKDLKSNNFSEAQIFVGNDNNYVMLNFDRQKPHLSINIDEFGAYLTTPDELNGLGNLACFLAKFNKQHD